MHPDYLPYRILCESLWETDPLGVESLLSAWLHEYPDEAPWIADLARRTDRTIPSLTVEERWSLYALSRISDTLISRLDEGQIPLSVFCSFLRALNLRQVAAGAFHPFYHEIVTVEQSSEKSRPIAVSSERWPAFMIGSMLFSRAGVAVTGGSDHVRKDVAEHSTLYWAWRRSNRPTEDLSLGWGSNSQWRTDFRQDYHLGERYFYNAGTSIADEERPDGPSIAQRDELLRHRCFIVSTVPHNDLYPYGYRKNED
jgi:hypothetical protein